jgi:ATP diphosphatase
MKDQPITALLSLMARLRSPDGCPWDRAQNFETIAPYTIEEAHEVADAIARNDMAALKDELGDLLFQVVFHAQMADEAGHFGFDDVARAIVSKMERRHPHVFGDGERPDWEATKAEERANADDKSALAGVALGLPALMRAEKLQKRAARTGFDWPDAEGPLAKVHEEIAEVQAATSAAHREEEVGDLLFAVVNWARHLGVDPEVALRSANAKFERRFRTIEVADGFSAMTLDEMEAEWVKAKRL